MKKIEYPIKELVRFEMDENKIWWLRYDREHECFPQPYKRINKKSLVEDTIVGLRVRNKKGYRDFVGLVNQFCREQNLTLEGEGFGMVSRYNRNIIFWGDKDVMGYSFPTLLKPITQSGSVFSMSNEWELHDTPPPYYGNPHYKKYVEDNNGECPLPLPEGINWWEV